MTYKQYFLKVIFVYKRNLKIILSTFALERPYMVFERHLCSKSWLWPWAGTGKTFVENFRKYYLYVMLLNYDTNTYLWNMIWIHTCEIWYEYIPVKYDINTYLWNMIWIHTCEIWYKYTPVVNTIGGVMVSVIASRAVDHWFKFCSGRDDISFVLDQHAFLDLF
jgi:hypothetical protein